MSEKLTCETLNCPLRSWCEYEIGTFACGVALGKRFDSYYYPFPKIHEVIKEIRDVTAKEN